MKIKTYPSWEFSLEPSDRIDPTLLLLLKHIEFDGKLTNAANAAGISYRHAWNIINKWNERFNHPLVLQQRERGTTLTPLEKKLVWAEQLIEAHLTPQIETLTSLINAEINEALGEGPNSLCIHASHGYAIALLPELIQKYTKHNVGIKFTGSVEAIRSLAAEDCDLAGLHLAYHPVIRAKVAKAYSPYLHQHKHVVIHMVTRKQGFIVANGNPKKITSFEDLTKPNVQLINRQSVAGTRVLLDEFLVLEKISSADISGYANEEFTHAAVAAHIASGKADVGFGIEYAAHNFKLDFIPIVDEQYVLACDKNWINSKLGKEIISIFKTQDFANGIEMLPGYSLDSPGEIISPNKFLNTNRSSQ